MSTTSVCQISWSSVAGAWEPAKGSAAFTATPCPTPDPERKTYLDTVPQKQKDSKNPNPLRTERHRSVDSSKTLVNEDSRHELLSERAMESLFQGCPPQPPVIDGSSRGLVLVRSRAATDEQTAVQWAMTDRELYHRLQNLSSYPSALAIARRRILTEMSQLLSRAESLSQDPLHIFSLPTKFNANEFRDFLQRQHDATTAKYSKYDERRIEAYRKAREGGSKHAEAQKAGMEMFAGGREMAKQWLRRASVVKYVDGAWLQHLLKITTGLATEGSTDGLCFRRSRDHLADWALESRRAVRASWQVMTEELGDGDLSRSHVAIYEALMDKLADEDSAPSPPKGEDRAFTEWPATGGPTISTDPWLNGQDCVDSRGNARCWRSGVSQLALSVSPNEFLPESIGWNSSYEGLPYHLLVSSRELQEHGLDAYYFWLHVSIDNASSGHSAMARECVVNYVNAAQRSCGDDFADEIWARIKLGFALADFIPTTPASANGRDDLLDDDTPAELTYTIVTQEDSGHLNAQKLEKGNESKDELRARMAAILASKARTAHGLHAGVHAKLAGETLSYWLDPTHAVARAPLLLDALSESPIWIKKGNPHSSKFVQEFQWGGKMFGALSNGEVEVLRHWVSSLDPVESNLGRDTDFVHSKMLIDDVTAERSHRLMIRDWLGHQRGLGTSEGTDVPLTEFASASSLRPAPLPACLHSMGTDVGSWDAFAQNAAVPIFRSIIRRPDCIRPLPKNIAKLLAVLDHGYFALGPTTQLNADISITSQLSKICQPPRITISHSLQDVLPSLAILTGLLEHSISLSPGRLASPLGMVAVKVLRILHGFTEDSNPATQDALGGDGIETGCMGTEDSLDSGSRGWWDRIEFLCNGMRGGGEEQDQALLLSDFLAYPCRRLALPALSLLLSSHFWHSAPILLGMALCIITTARQGYVLDRLSASGDHEDSLALERRLSSAVVWLERGVSIGVDAQRHGSVPRGASLLDEDLHWSGHVIRGWNVAVGGLHTATR